MVFGFCMLPDKRYVLAVSGGLDSMVLTHLFAQTLSARNLVIAHFNHKTRGEESDRDERFVRRQAKKNGILCVVGNRRGSKTSEEALRNERMLFLRQVRRETACDYIVTGHHLDDQLETVLMRLMRGTGLDGMVGITPTRGRFLRPLLAFSRSDLFAYAKQNKIKWREDSSNKEQSYLRNRIRHELLPVFFRVGQEYGTRDQCIKRFQKTIQELQWAIQEVEKKTVRLYGRHAVETPFWIRLNEPKLQTLNPYWRKRVLKRALRRVGVRSVLTRDLEAMESYFRTSKKALMTSGNIQLSRSCGFVFLQNEQQRALTQRAFRFHKTEGRYTCSDLGLRIHVRSGMGELRFATPGDWRSAHKLKKELLERRIPSFERKFLPVLVKKGSKEVLWCFPEKKNGIRIEENHFLFSFEDCLKVSS